MSESRLRSGSPKGSDLILSTRQALQAELSDIRKSSINFFIPFAMERSPTGKLLPRLSDEAERNLKQCHRNTARSAVRVLKPLVFGYTLHPSRSRIKHDRYPSPPPGMTKHVWPLPRTDKRKLVPARNRFGEMHTRAHSMDFINYEAISQKQHITGVDMSKALARDKEVGVDLEEVLGKMAFKLPDHVRKFKGFYEGSGLKSNGMEKPQTLFKEGNVLTDDIQKRMHEIKQHLV